MSACAGRVAPVPAAPAEEPRLFWRVRAGPLDGHQEEMCRSDTRRECVIPASTTGEPIVAAVSLFLYPAGMTTTYDGTVSVGFIRSTGQRGHEMQVNYRSDPDELPIGFTTAGRITQEPGEYQVRISLVGTTPTRSKPYHLERVVRVRIE
jgi:hypothetical protein